MVWWAWVPSVWGLHGDILRHINKDNGEKEGKDEILGDHSFCQSNQIKLFSTFCVIALLTY